MFGIHAVRVSCCYTGERFYNYSLVLLMFSFFYALYNNNIYSINNSLIYKIMDETVFLKAPRKLLDNL